MCIKIYTHKIPTECAIHWLQRTVGAISSTPSSCSKNSIQDAISRCRTCPKYSRSGVTKNHRHGRMSPRCLGWKRRRWLSGGSGRGPAHPEHLHVDQTDRPSLREICTQLRRRCSDAVVKGIFLPSDHAPAADTDTVRPETHSECRRQALIVLGPDRRNHSSHSNKYRGEVHWTRFAWLGESPTINRFNIYVVTFYEGMKGGV